MQAEGGVLDLSIITQEILVGSQITCADDLITLKKLGVGGLLSLQDNEDHARAGIRWNILERVGREERIDLRRIPIRDFDPGDLISKIEECMAELDDLLRDYRRVYVHCTVGINRSPGVVISYLVLNNGMNVEGAYRLVKSKRPVVSPYRTLLELLGTTKRRERFGQ